MVYVNGQIPIIILEFGEELLSNNSNICVIQSNQKWDPETMIKCVKQLPPEWQVLYLHGGTSDVQTPTDDKNAPSEPTNDSDVIKEYIKNLELEHRFFMDEYFKRPNKELDESLNNLSEEAKFLLFVLLLSDIMRKQKGD